MRRLLPPILPMLLLPLLAACAEGGRSIFDRTPEPEGPPPLPPAVQAALPPGVPSSVVLQDGNGCYLYSIERTDPPSGYPLRDALGTPICEGGPPPVLVADASPLPPPSAVAPEPAAPIVESTLDPVDDAADEEVEEMADPEDDAPDAPPATDPLLPPEGGITPPAPLAPLE